MLASLEAKVEGFEQSFKKCEGAAKELWDCKADLLKAQETLKGKGAEIVSLR